MARRIRFAIYTPKSSEEGLDQDFNSLDAQAKACAAYVASQKAEGWVLVPTRCDDGGSSGGTLERPALQRPRYHISRKLVTDRLQKHPDAWRLPARDLETGIARILRDHLTKPTVLTDLVRDLSAAEIPGLQEKFRQLANDCDPDDGADLWAPLLRRADLQQGSILLRLDRKILAERLGILPDRRVSFELVQGQVARLSQHPRTVSRRMPDRDLRHSGRLFCLRFHVSREQNVSQGVEHTPRHARHKTV